MLNVLLCMKHTFINDILHIKTLNAIDFSTHSTLLSNDNILIAHSQLKSVQKHVKSNHCTPQSEKFLLK